MSLHINVRSGLLLALMLAALSGAAQATGTPVVQWNRAALDEVRRLKLGPPIVARALAVAHTCMYEAWVPYDGQAVGQVMAAPKRPAVEQTDANKAKAVSFAAYRCLLNLFPSGAMRLQSVMASYGYDVNDTAVALNTPQGLGNAAAAAVLAARRYDGANQYGDLYAGSYADYTGYAPRNNPMGFCLPQSVGSCASGVVDPYHWQPLINDKNVLQRFIAPHWENVTPFALSSASQFDNRPEAIGGPNYLKGSANYVADMNDILQNSAALDARRKLIVEYWADGPDSELPPGHWGLFAQAVSLRDAHNIDADVKMFFAMHNASFDAGIVAWHLKRKYDGVRPITAIRYFLQGQQVLAWGGPGRPTEWIDGGTWTPYNPGSNLTPAFPGWVSGHATFSAASAAVLRAFTGSDYFGFSTVIPANFGRVEPGVPAVPTTISYPTFKAAADEAALSRIYAGIHFADDNNVGLALGDLVGRQAWDKSRFLFDGGLKRTNSSRTTAAWSPYVQWTHTVDSLNNRLLVVGVSTTASTTAATSVSFNGLPLTRLGVQNGPSGDNRVEFWYLLAPPSGAGTMRVQLSTFDDVVAGAMSFSGVNQAAPFGTFRSAANTSGSACVTLANAPAPLVASVLSANGDAWSVTAGSGLSEAWNAVSDHSLLGLLAFADVIGMGASGPAAPLANICHTLGASRRWSMVAVPLNPAF